MTIYRGPGGASETTDSATISAVQTYASQAAASATAAASSASTAATNATAAASSASAASTSVTNAATQVSAAATQASNAATSATEAAASASDASTSAASALSYANAASGHATDANGYMNNAETYKDRAEAAAAEAAGYVSTTASSATAAANSATAAAGSATTASGYADDAAASATEASGYADDASDSADAAASSASASATSATASQAAADAALTALDSFDDRYLGQKTSDPTVDNDGNALATGALYFNTTDNAMKVYDGSAWLSAYASLSGALLAVNNLSDLSSASAARTNLGLGTAAITNSTAYATAAQGALADTAVQPAAIANMLETSDIGVSVQAYNANTVVDASYVHTDNNYTTTEKNKLAGIAEGAEVNVNADWNASSGDAQILNKPTLGTASAQDVGYFATAAQGTNADTAHGWGNHASAGYLTSFTETDPVYVASSWYSTTNNASNWNTAYGWGNHASAGYAQSNGSNASGTWGIAISGNAATATSATTASSASQLASTNWTVVESGGVLYFKYGGTNKAKLDSSGNLTVVGNVTAYGTV